MRRRKALPVKTVFLTDRFRFLKFELQRVDVISVDAVRSVCVHNAGCLETGRVRRCRAMKHVLYILLNLSVYRIKNDIVMYCLSLRTIIFVLEVLRKLFLYTPACPRLRGVSELFCRAVPCSESSKQMDRRITRP